MHSEAGHLKPDGTVSAVFVWVPNHMEHDSEPEGSAMDIVEENGGWMTESRGFRR